MRERARLTLVYFGLAEEDDPPLGPPPRPSWGNRVRLALIQGIVIGALITLLTAQTARDGAAIGALCVVLMLAGDSLGEWSRNRPRHVRPRVLSAEERAEIARLLDAQGLDAAARELSAWTGRTEREAVADIRVAFPGVGPERV